MKFNKKINIILVSVILVVFIFWYFIFSCKENNDNNLDGWKNIEESNLVFIIPEDAKIISEDDFAVSEYDNDDLILTLRKTKLEDSWFNNIEDWYKLNQERGFFWVRYFKIASMDGGVIKAFVVRQSDFDINSRNFQMIKFVDEDNNFYDLVLRGFSDKDLEIFMKNILFKQNS